MSQRPTIARVRLARSLPRLLAVPFLIFLFAGAAIAGGLLVVAPPVGFALIAIGGLLGALGLALMVTLLSVRLDVGEAAIQVSWIGGSRSYVLSPGPVTRVRLRGANTSRLRVRTGAFGWSLGRAVLRGEEPIHIVRLAPTATAILVPTDRGRLAIAPARDEDLLDALSRAARARQQVEAAESREEGEPAETAAAAIEPSAAESSPAVAAVAVPQRPLTGIERALLEQQLAEEQEAAERGTVVEPSNVEAEAVAEPEAVAETERVEPDAVPPEAAAAPARERRRIRLGQPGVRAAFVVLPLLGAGLAWAVGAATGNLPQPGSDLGRLTSLALITAGPATSVGAVMAMAWWPRLVGVVVTGGLVASVFIGRALLGA
jgi:hypothetical protein